MRVEALLQDRWSHMIQTAAEKSDVIREDPNEIDGYDIMYSDEFEGVGLDYMTDESGLVILGVDGRFGLTNVQVRAFPTVVRLNTRLIVRLLYQLWQSWREWLNTDGNEDLAFEDMVSSSFWNEGASAVLGKILMTVHNLKVHFRFLKDKITPRARVVACQIVHSANSSIKLEFEALVEARVSRAFTPVEMEYCTHAPAGNRILLGRGEIVSGASFNGEEKLEMDSDQEDW